jgi:glycosyltransferase involved in cell wall biosynthesis
MFFSIIVPCFNSQVFLKKCLNSIFLNISNEFLFEVIVIDDGSTDDTLLVIKSFKNHINLIEIIQKNFGPSYARNRGLEIAKGDYILFLDSDDYYIENTLKCLFNNIKINNFPDLIEFNFSFMKTKLLFESPINKKSNFNGISHYLNVSQINSVSNKVYKRSFLQEISISFHEKISIAEDLYFNTEVLLNAQKVVAIPESLLVVNNLNIQSSTRVKTLKNRIRIISQLKYVFCLIFIKLDVLNDSDKELFLRLKLTNLFYSILFQTYFLNFSRNKTLISINKLESFHFLNKSLKNKIFFCVYRIFFNGK